MPIPYMGSKRTDAQHIVALIRAYCPNATEIYDVFCGGLAVSEEAVKKGFSVHASDLNAAVVALGEEVIHGKAIDPKTGKSIFEEPRFISREEFSEGSKGAGWWAGYLQCIWSFGNSGHCYLFGQDSELYKKAAHAFAVYKDRIELEKLAPRLRLYLDKIENLPTWHERRIALARVAKLQQLQQLQRLEQLEQLERLQQLQQLQQLQRLEQRCCSYDEAEIPPGAVIYCDPPYFDSAGYRTAPFDHVKFYDWAREKAKTNPVFISEYTAPEDFKCIYTFNRRQVLCVNGDRGKPERIFYLDLRKGNQ